MQDTMDSLKQITSKSTEAISVEIATIAQKIHEKLDIIRTHLRLTASTKTAKGGAILPLKIVVDVDDKDDKYGGRERKPKFRCQWEYIENPNYPPPPRKSPKKKSLSRDSPKPPPKQKYPPRNPPHFTYADDDELQYSPIKPSDDPALQVIKSEYFAVATKFQEDVYLKAKAEEAATIEGSSQ
ncbi:hypothetical protein L2E82_31093 [Cichorium intybus]|uniref:Uncharacterized protein n=1 Tax=Cichorium intybus TaxID=13427 RepID=A0ACB9D2D4_CICIN|nr:hypothetical protein L2E82_31093 [Cichorium intybus]